MSGTETTQSLVAKTSKQYKSLKVTNEDEILQSWTKESVVSFRLVEIQYGVLSVMLDAS